LPGKKEGVLRDSLFSFGCVSNGLDTTSEVSKVLYPAASEAISSRFCLWNSRLVLRCPRVPSVWSTNNNGCINGADVSALIPNFLKSGPITVAGYAVHASGVTSQDVRLVSGEGLSLSPSSRSVPVGVIFTMDIVADTGTSTADTVDAYIDFDPTYLEVVDESGTPVSAIELNTDVFSNATFNSVDNATGQINFSASEYDSPYLTGSFTVATIRFKAKAAVESTSINFARSGARWSDLYLFGESINPTLTNGTATVICPDFVDPPGVGVEDIMLVANCWRCKCGDVCYDSRYDIDDDCDIDIVDIMLVVAHWGETCN